MNAATAIQYHSAEYCPTRYRYCFVIA